MYSSKVKQALRKFTIRGSEMTRIKSSVVSMAAYAALLVFIFAGGVGAANCPPDDEVNLRWTTTPPTFMYHDYITHLSVGNDHNGGTYSWSCSNNALGVVVLNPPRFATATNGVGQVTIYCTYTFEESGQPCSYTISHSINVVGAEMFVDSNHDGQANASDNATEETPGGFVGQGQNIYVYLAAIPTAAGGTCTLKLSQSSLGGQVSVFDPQNNPITIPWNTGISWSAGTAPSYIRVYGAQASQSPRDVYLSYTYTYPDDYYYEEPEVDVIALTVVGNVDLDVDSNYDGQINGTDESLETSAGGVVPLGKRVPISITAQGNVGTLMLYVDSGYGDKIRVWSAEEGGTEILYGQTVSVGTYYVQGVSTSSSARDIQLRLRKSYGTVIKEDTIKLTVVNPTVDLDVDSDYDLDIDNNDESLETSAGGVVFLGERVPIRIASQGSLGLGTLVLSADSGDDKITGWSAAEGGTQMELDEPLAVGTYYVEGIEKSSSARDIQLRLRYTYGSSYYGSSYIEDTIKLTVVDVDLDVDSNYDGIIDDRDDYTEDDTQGGLVFVDRYTRVDLKNNIPSDAGGLVTLEFWGAGKASAFRPDKTTPVDSISWNPGGSPTYIYVRGDQVSGDQGDVVLTYKYIRNGVELASDIINLTVVDIDTSNIYPNSLEFGESTCISYEISAPDDFRFGGEYNTMFGVPGFRFKSVDMKVYAENSSYVGSKNLEPGVGEYNIDWDGTINGKYLDPEDGPYTVRIAASFEGEPIYYDCGIVTTKLEDIDFEEESFSKQVSSTITADGNNVEISADFNGEWAVEDLDPNCLDLNKVDGWIIVNNSTTYPVDISVIDNRVEVNGAISSFSLPLSAFLSGGIKVDIYVSVYGQECLLKTITLDGQPCSLVPDYDRNGKINDADKARWNNNEIFYFWVNDDDDEDADEGDDRPGGGRADWKDSTWVPFLGKYVVDSVRDFVDFFPVWVDIKDALDICPASDYDYVLKHSAGAFNAYINPGLTPSEADKHLFNQAYCEANENAELEHIDATGYTLPADILDEIKNNNKALILVEARAATQAPLVLEIKKKSDGTVICTEEMAVSIDSVEQMFRHKNLRSVAGGSGGEADRLGEPSNYPDSLTINKHFVFIHGYNVSGDAAHASQCEIFKRMYWSGSNAKFHGISWFGNDTQIPLIQKTPNYHINVVNAFNTADALKTYLNGLSGDVIVAAHSLGNMLTSASITMEGANVSKYMIINGAVAMEAYKADQTNEWGMVHSDWDDYLFGGTNDFLFSSEWHELFGSTDPRNKLTWQGLFTSWGSTTVYDYYSPGEDVVANVDHDDGNLFDVAGFAWGCQEKLKGRMPIGYLVGSRYAGWGFNTDDYGSWDTDEIGDLVWTSEPPAAAQTIPPNNLKTEPFFLNDPDELFDADENVAKAYAQNNRIWLLARTIPARTFGIGANAMSGMTSRNMQDDLRAGWYQTEIRWKHSSFKNVAYLYTFPMYNQIVKDGGLK